MNTESKKITITIVYSKNSIDTKYDLQGEFTTVEILGLLENCKITLHERQSKKSIDSQSTPE